MWSYYPGTKADELAGYYMGCAIQDIEDTRMALVGHSQTSPVADRAEADRLGGTVFTFDQIGNAPGVQPTDAGLRARMNGLLGDCSIIERAEYSHSKIGVEPDRLSKAVLYQNALGLKPPISIRELVARLNDPARNGPAFQTMRENIYKGRLFQASRRR